MNHNLYYAIENILKDLAFLITYNKKLSPKIVRFYLDLQTMQENSEFDFYTQHYEELTPEILIAELNDQFHDALDIYFDDLYSEALEKYS